MVHVKNESNIEIIFITKTGWLITIPQGGMQQYPVVVNSGEDLKLVMAVYLVWRAVQEGLELLNCWEQLK